MIEATPACDIFAAIPGCAGPPHTKTNAHAAFVIETGRCRPANEPAKEKMMLYLVRMDVNPPRDLDPAEFSKTKAREKEYSLGLQRDGRWRHIWRVVGQYSNYSIFDVASNDELHKLLQDLPLFPYMNIEVTPLATHPSDLAAQ